MMAGKIREKKDAASITPAVKPRSVSWDLTETFLPKRTGMAPTAVIAPAVKLARVP